MHDLSRRFFHILLRHKQVVKAFQLAVDINDYDLFVDIYHSANRLGLKDLADASMIKAQAVFHELPATTNEGHQEEALPNTSSDESEDSLPPPPPTPPPPPPPSEGNLAPPAFRIGPMPDPPAHQSLVEPELPFSTVTTVQVEHPLPSPPPPPPEPDRVQLVMPQELAPSASKAISAKSTTTHTFHKQVNLLFTTILRPCQ